MHASGVHNSALVVGVAVIVFEGGLIGLIGLVDLAKLVGVVGL